MSETRRSEIIYEEGWHETAPSSPVDEPPVDEQEPLPEKEHTGSKPLLITIQLILCLLAALALFLLKTMDSGIYRDFMDFYHSELNKPLVSRDVFEAVDIGALFDDSTVTVQATPDEAENS